jgi:hypothetical protein
MATLIMGGTDWSAPEADENVVRRNTAPVDATPEPAEIEHDPGFNELAEDSNPAIGMTTRQLGSKWYDRVKSAPGLFLALTKGHNAHNNMINRQIASSGTAAGREDAGEWGHGSFPFAVGIEPLNPAQVYGQDYFKAYTPESPNPAPYDAGVRPAMGNGNDRDAIGAQSAEAKTNARDAGASAMYDRFLLGR